MKRSLLLNFLGIFLFGFAVIYACYVGLPVDFNSDYIASNIRGADSLSYLKLIRLTLNPLTPAWFYPSAGLMEYLRPLQFLLMKLFFDWFHYSLIPFHVSTAVGHGFLLTIFALIIFYYTRSILLSWLGALLYASFPSNFFMLVSTFALDFQFFLSILTLVALFLFGLLTFGKLKSKLSFFLGVLGWICASWLAIKLKSSEKIIPFICLAFLIFRLRFVIGRIGLLRMWILILGIAGMMILVIPFKPFESWTNDQGFTSKETASIQPSSEKDKQTLSFQWNNLLERTFFVPGGEFPFTTVVRRNIPQSFTENYGFFLGWLFWVSLLLTPIVLARSKVSTDLPFRDQEGEMKRHCFWLMLIWFGATIAGFANGLNVRDIRLLNFAYVPSVLLLFMMVGTLEQNFFSAAKKRLFFRIAVAVFVLYTSFSNFFILAKLLGHFGGFQNALVRAEKDVFQSFYHESPDERTLYERHQDLENRALVVDWYQLPENWFQAAVEKLNREKTVYVYTRTAQSERLEKFKTAGYEPIFLKRYDFLDAKPLIFRAFKRVAEVKHLTGTSGKENAILVYQIKGS